MEFKKFQKVKRFGTNEVKGISRGKCMVYPKLDGTNGSVWLGDDGKVKAGSRNRELTLEEDNQGFYAYIKKQDNIKNFLLDNPEKRLYGEWLVPHTLKTYRDDAWNKFYVFDVAVDKEPNEITHEGDDTVKYITYDKYQPLLEEYDIEYIPPIAIIENGTKEKFVNQLEKNIYLVEDGKGMGEGCFKSDTEILMHDESTKPINTITVGDIVKSYNTNTKKIENKKVLNVYFNGLKPVSKWKKFNLFPRGYSSRGNASKAFIATKDHLIYDGKNYSEIDKNEYFYYYDWVIDQYRKQAILGLIMSDGHLHKNITLGFSQKFGNKSNCLIDFFKPIINKPHIYTSGKGSKMCNVLFTKRYITIFDKYLNTNGKQNYSKISKELNDIGWAFMFMGDGSSERGGGIRIATHGIPSKHIHTVLNNVNEYFDIKAKLKKDNRVKNNGGYGIRINTEDGKKIQKRIGKYLLEPYRYKLKKVEINNYFNYPNMKKGLAKKKLYRKKEIRDLKTYNRNKNFGAWDIEVADNHNYFAGGVLVHNCVIKNYDFYNKYNRQVWAKIVTNKHKENHAKEMGAPEIQSQTTVEDKIIDNYLTQHKIEKVYAKIKSQKGWESEFIPELLGRVWHDLITEEIWDIIKDYNNPTINFNTLHYECVNKIKQVKSELF